MAKEQLIQLLNEGAKMEKGYILEIEDNEDGTCKVKKRSYGLNAFELLGHLTYTIRDIEKQISGEINAEIIERKVFVDKKEEK